MSTKLLSIAIAFAIATQPLAPGQGTQGLAQGGGAEDPTKGLDRRKIQEAQEQAEDSIKEIQAPPPSRPAGNDPAGKKERRRRSGASH